MKQATDYLCLRFAIIIILVFLTDLACGRNCSHRSRQRQQRASGEFNANFRRCNDNRTTSNTNDDKKISGTIASRIPSKKIGVDVHGYDVRIPLVGSGTWQYNDTMAYDSLCKAFAAGITFVDTAFGYRNQYGVGKAIQDCFYDTKSIGNGEWIGQEQQRTLRDVDASLPHQKRQHARTREDLFVLTKVPGGLSIDETMIAHHHNLRLLNMDYVDHLMLHFPADWDVTPERSNRYVRQDQWRALEELYYTGKVRSIGVSHYCSNHIDDILAIATVPISLNQVEYHVGSQDIDSVIEKCRQTNITFMSFSPLCGPCQYEPRDSLIHGDLVSGIAKKYPKHNLTGAQVSLRFIIQQALQPGSPMGPVIPKSDDVDHIRSNMDLFSFELTDEDMQLLRSATKPSAEDGDCDVP